MWMAGGLGNQLFILNKALELKEKNRFLFLDTYFYDNDVRYKRKFHFKEKLKIIPVFNKKLRYILFRLNKVLNKINMFYFRDESNFSFTIFFILSLISITSISVVFSLV